MAGYLVDQFHLRADSHTHTQVRKDIGNRAIFVKKKKYPLCWTNVVGMISLNSIFEERTLAALLWPCLTTTLMRI